MAASHPLDGAFFRWQRADQHLSEARKMLIVWGDACVDKIVRDEHGKHRFSDGYADVPPLLPVVVSDAVHNFRAALDYLVYELAIKDSGKPQDGTQFLIEDVKSDPADPKRGFDARRKSYLRGLNAAHIAAIESQQPYMGGLWAETLRDISNPDKHRHLSALTKDGRNIAYTTHHHPGGRFSENDFDVTSVGITERRFDVKVDGYQTIAITLPKRGETAIMPLLDQIEVAILSVLEAFKPEF